MGFETGFSVKPRTQPPAPTPATALREYVPPPPPPPPPLQPSDYHRTRLLLLPADERLDAMPPDQLEQVWLKFCRDPRYATAEYPGPAAFEQAMRRLLEDAISDETSIAEDD
ncbi:hypothetical protein [Gloeobacter kilaueensis]|uniref:Uncharacterized protein n=1 Tax=Gloeobacter kilaueensis (strain ATCC BAA-2537 / CCAP 1431/1 / ULC 316 / JS1) TaxID=1183438 RepID=U5QDT6_GLOK1|nr:hypothetical protein [Gloeobacter kilaueensis]AGY57028.1 hypothetical protein GKIL_0782 [Gloeobacter kilaueensis JS1]